MKLERLAGKHSTDSVKCSLLHNCKVLLLCYAMWVKFVIFKCFARAIIIRNCPIMWDFYTSILKFRFQWASSSQTQMLAKLDNLQLCGRKAINQAVIKRAHIQHLMNHHTGRFPNRRVAVVGQNAVMTDGLNCNNLWCI